MQATHTVRGVRSTSHGVRFPALPVSLDPLRFCQAVKVKAPPELYVSFDGREAMGVGLVIKVGAWVCERQAGAWVIKVGAWVCERQAGARVRGLGRERGCELSPNVMSRARWEAVGGGGDEASQQRGGARAGGREGEDDGINSSSGCWRGGGRPSRRRRHLTHTHTLPTALRVLGAQWPGPAPACKPFGPGVAGPPQALGLVLVFEGNVHPNPRAEALCRCARPWVQRHPEWTLILPLDPLVNAIGCELTIGVVSRGGDAAGKPTVSRKAIWDWIRTTLVLVCRAAPFAFVFSYEDHDVGEAGVVEVGFYDYKADAFLVQHRGLPGAEEMEKRAREQRRV
ncbi:MAG: hypothetical protein WDW38_009212 [Sanguina aurantia]